MLRKDQLPTPVLLVDLEVLRRNIGYMADKAKRKGVQLRPHMKTHKSKKIAHMQLAAGAVGLTCAKISEAEVMVEAGVHDLFIAYPMYGDYQLAKAAVLAKRCRLTLACDSLPAAQKLDSFARAAGITFRVSMIVDTGTGRDGVLPEQAVELAKQIAPLENLALRGVMTHEGHLYRCSSVQEVEEQAILAAQKLVAAAQQLRQAGFQIDTVSTGSTPGCYANVAVQGVTEWRPGTYVFNDAQETGLGVTEQDCALTVKATVVSHPAPDRYLLDAGSKVLSEASHHKYGHGIIKGAPQARIVKVNEEHGYVQAPPGTFAIGQQVEVIPVHVCTVVNLSNAFYIVENDQVLDRWTVDARGLVL